MVTREVFWNIPSKMHIFMFAALIVSLCFFGWGIFRHVRIWLGGLKDKEAFCDIGLRFRLVLKNIFGQMRFHGSSRILHMGIFYGFLGLFIGTIFVSIEYDILYPLGYSMLKGRLYLSFSLILDILGLFMIIGLIAAMTRRRASIKPETLSHTLEDDFILILFMLIVITGFLVEGLRIAGTHRPGWEIFSPVGYGISTFFTGVKEDTVKQLHSYFWICHMLLSFVLISIIPYTKLIHIISAPLNIFFSPLTPKRIPDAPFCLKDDSEEEIAAKDFRLGAGRITDLKRWQIIGCDACTQCGVCDSLCPAFLSEKPLSPREVMLKMRGLFHSSNNKAQDSFNDIFTLAELSSCTTCGACVENCPVHIKHLSVIIELRRNLVFEGLFDNGHRAALHRTLDYQNPFALTERNRDTLLDTIGIEKAVGNNKYDVLYWFGCSGYFDERTQDIIKAVCNILKKAGQSVAALGASEYCCGDFARRIGDEGLFQKLAIRNIQTIKEIDFDTLLTHCPHGYNIMKHEYPFLGADFKVNHHTEYICNLLDNGDINVDARFEEVIYHDPCYLGRYNKVYDPPRNVLYRIAGNTVEFPLSHDRSFCCGAGGGHMWKQEEIGTRINDIRIEQAVEIGVNMVASACPFCLAMLEDALLVKGLAPDKRVKDIAELVNEAIL